MRDESEGIRKGMKKVVAKEDAGFLSARDTSEIHQ
jgi:hypothetical protein